jgi:hypothetical protein
VLIDQEGRLEGGDGVHVGARCAVQAQSGIVAVWRTARHGTALSGRRGSAGGAGPIL